MVVPLPPPPATNQQVTRQRSCYNDNFRGSTAPEQPQHRAGFQPVSGEQTAPAGPGRQETRSISDDSGRIHRRASRRQRLPTPPAPAAPAPKLGDVLTSDEQKQYSASIDQSLSQAQNSLNSIAGRSLKKDQQAEVEQIRNFMQQAQATRTSDPAGAKSLAERAEVLARDLAASFR